MGAAAAEALAAKGRAVLLACRNRAKADALRRDILARHPGARLEIGEVDLSPMASIRRFVKTLILDWRLPFSTMPALSRGVSSSRRRPGKTFTVNYFGPWLLTRLLAEKMPEGGRIVNMVSLTCWFVRIDMDSLRLGRKDFSQLVTYARSKRALEKAVLGPASVIPPIDRNAPTETRPTALREPAARNGSRDITELWIPKQDIPLAKTIAERMSWVFPVNYPQLGLERTLDDILNGNVTEYADFDDMMEEIGKEDSEILIPREHTVQAGCQAMHQARAYYRKTESSGGHPAGKRPAAREYKPHKLAGPLGGLWECHIQSDSLLIWEQKEDELILLMTRTGTHSDVFD